MKRILITIASFLMIAPFVLAQQTKESPSIVKVSKALLAGEGLNNIPQEDTSRTAYQKTVYSGADIAVFMVALGTGITNEFNGFPLEEFIFWANGKAVVEPKGEEAFPIYSGDYFIQAKGFSGKWNFIDIGGPHLELALVAKNRPDSSFKSPMSKAMVLDRNMLSGVIKPENDLIYQGPELTVNLISEQSKLSKTSQERMLHVLNGVLTVTTEDQAIHEFFPGDFLIIPADLKCQFEVKSLQNIRILEVYKTRLERY